MLTEGNSERLDTIACTIAVLKGSEKPWTRDPFASSCNSRRLRLKSHVISGRSFRNSDQVTGGLRDRDFVLALDGLACCLDLRAFFDRPDSWMDLSASFDRSGSWIDLVASLDRPGSCVDWSASFDRLESRFDPVSSFFFLVGFLKGILTPSKLMTWSDLPSCRVRLTLTPPNRASP